MTYVQFTPSPPLNAYINCVYYCDQSMPYTREQIMPTPWHNLMINFGGAFKAYEAGESKPFVTCSDSWWLGLRGAHHIVEWPRDMQLFIVDFKPGGAYPFLEIPLSELHHQVVPLDAVWGTFAADMREQLYTAPTNQARFSLLERLLLARLRPAPDRLSAMQNAVNQIAASNGALSIRALSDQMGISQKHLIAQFKRLVGGTPKELARMYRFLHVLYTIDPAQPADWTHIAHQFEYYDQSHFNREFAAFTGLCPTDYLNQRRRVQAEHPQHARYVRQLATG
ncbi:MAG: AraC family transcriptional regulator [Chloroflexota bacterium]